MADDLSAAALSGSPTAQRPGQFVRNIWYVAMWANELAPGALIGRTILNEPILFFRREDGSVAAMSDTCPHRFAPLSMGKVLGGDRVQCPYHGLEFAADGRCVHNPHGSGAIPQASHLRSYPTVEKHQLIWIWMGPKTPDPAKIPDYSCIDRADPLHITDPGYINMKCHYGLLVDNLLDLSHTSYLHAGLLGNNDTLVTNISVEQQGDVITVSRPSPDSDSPGMLLMLDALPHGDQYNSISWFPPSCLLLEFGVGPTGGPKSEGAGYIAVHLITPETDRTSHYNFTAIRWGVRSKDEARNREIRDKIAAGRRFAFAEQDQPVIEAQQRRMDESPVPLKPVLLSIDAGPVQYQRVLERLLQEDQA
mgnify:CR=1 FL=1